MSEVGKKQHRLFTRGHIFYHKILKMSALKLLNLSTKTKHKKVKKKKKRSTPTKDLISLNVLKTTAENNENAEN